LARIRLLEIRNFRSVKALTWYPINGLNCLIGPGDSGKSTILEAIDLCLTARRGVQVSDADFHDMNVKEPIVIRVTFGALPEPLKDLEAYGNYFRAFDPKGLILDEPKRSLETVLTMQLQVGADLEPVWSLYSDRSASADPPRMLRWKERLALSPARLSAHTSSNLAWNRNSVLNRLSEERASVSAEILEAARLARETFGGTAEKHLTAVLDEVTQVANALAVPVGDKARALLDAHTVSFDESAISLHSQNGVPLRNLGTGSLRLLVGGLHRAAAKAASIVISDEVEMGLEPHRIAHLLQTLGAKDSDEPLQGFFTTHSAVVLRELKCTQLQLVRPGTENHVVRQLPPTAQGPVRDEPESFLAHNVLVCEGATEVGFVRGLGRFWIGQGFPPLEYHGLGYANVHGSFPELPFRHAKCMLELGYRAAVLADNDKRANAEIVRSFEAIGGRTFCWMDGLAIEQALFRALPKSAVLALVEKAHQFAEKESEVDNHIKTASDGKCSLAKLRSLAGERGDLSPETREWLGSAAKKRSWFKTHWKMEEVSFKIVGPSLEKAEPTFAKQVRELQAWIRNCA
jgi:putative ATP-dependent endonuclease of the OLD family